MKIEEVLQVAAFFLLTVSLSNFAQNCRPEMELFIKQDGGQTQLDSLYVTSEKRRRGLLQSPNRSTFKGSLTRDFRL